MNQLSLIQYVLKACQTIPDTKKSLEFVTAQITRLKGKPEHTDAYTLAVTITAHLKLTAGDLVGCKADLDEAEKLLDEIPGTEPTINASFYRVAAEYYNVKSALPEYYKNALLYLSCVNLEDIPEPERRERAYQLALSALLGEGIYNFGELANTYSYPAQLMHPILDSTPSDWLRELLFCFNRGDAETFNKVSRHPEFLKTPLLVKSLPQLNQKLCLMSLIESVFRRDKDERSRLTFEMICKDTGVALDEVEHLVMKALSLGLIKGSIDEIQKTVA
ncbi:26S proteasome regulatory subunit, partial [Dinochytrium kinnereticum]